MTTCRIFDFISFMPTAVRPPSVSGQCDVNGFGSSIIKLHFVWSSIFVHYWNTWKTNVDDFWYLQHVNIPSCYCGVYFDLIVVVPAGWMNVVHSGPLWSTLLSVPCPHQLSGWTTCPGRASLILLPSGLSAFILSRLSLALFHLFLILHRPPPVCWPLTSANYNQSESSWSPLDLWRVRWVVCCCCAYVHVCVCAL